MKRFKDIDVTTQTYIAKLKSACVVNLDQTYRRLAAMGGDVKYDVEGKNFLNCISIRYRLDTDRRVATKIFSNGTFQFTGCKSIDDVVVVLINGRVIRHLDLVGDDNPLTFKIYSVMRNIDFDLGFNIDRIRLGKYFSNDVPQFVVPPMTSSFMGVKLKLIVDLDRLLRVDHLRVDGRSPAILRRVASEQISSRRKDRKKQAFVSINIFSNGTVIMSAADEQVQENAFDRFMQAVEKGKDTFMVENVSTERNTFW